MFPEVETTVVEKQNTQAYGQTTYLFDFSKGDFVVRDGKLVKIYTKSALSTKYTDWSW